MKGDGLCGELKADKGGVEWGVVTSVAGCCRYSGQGRVGQSGVQATGWVSDTSVVCKMSGGVGGSLVVGVTAGGRAGSVSESLSLDGSEASSVLGANVAATGGGSMSVSGADLGTSR